MMTGNPWQPMATTHGNPLKEKGNQQEQLGGRHKPGGERTNQEEGIRAEINFIKLSSQTILCVPL